MNRKLSYKTVYGLGSVEYVCFKSPELKLHICKLKCCTIQAKDLITLAFACNY
jgi:hypothetical protein